MQEPPSPAVCPSAPPTAAPLFPTGSRTVTLADYGQTLALQVGDRFLLDLGSGYAWTVRLSDPMIISAVGSIPGSVGLQTVYEAEQPGETTLSAEGRPQCEPAAGACPGLVRGFRIQVVVS